mmetsp:Transcript_112987/g.258787  ORF Transcript_112987/g.258787 Transcript_112987/m.258787 type:complete len:226 (-) Transcript_112987:1023-1700(-)
MTPWTAWLPAQNGSVRQPWLAAWRGQLAEPSAPLALPAGFQLSESPVVAQPPHRRTGPKFFVDVPSCGDCPRGPPHDRYRLATAAAPTTRCRTDPLARFRKSDCALEAIPESQASPRGARCIGQTRASIAAVARHAECEWPQSPLAQMVLVELWVKCLPLFQDLPTLPFELTPCPLQTNSGETAQSRSECSENQPRLQEVVAATSVSAVNGLGCDWELVLSESSW